MLRRLLNTKISLQSRTYRVLFVAFRSIYRVGLMRNNTSVEVLRTPRANLILLPLSGTSTLRQAAGCTVSDAPDPDKPTYLLSRDTGLRAQSFFNKKVRNPDTFAKCRMLATCPPLTADTSIEEFLTYLENLPEPGQRDKHLWSETDICAKFPNLKIDRISLAQDQAVIEKLIGGPLPQSANRTSDVATAQPPVTFTPDQLDKAQRAIDAA